MNTWDQIFEEIYKDLNKYLNDAFHTDICYKLFINWDVVFREYFMQPRTLVCYFELQFTFLSAIIYLGHMYPIEFEIKDKTEDNTSTSCFNLLWMDDRLHTSMERQINIYSNICTYLQIFEPRYK